MWQALAAGRQELQQRLAGSDAQLQRAMQEAKAEQERRRVSDEGAQPAGIEYTCALVT